LFCVDEIEHVDQRRALKALGFRVGRIVVVPVVVVVVVVIVQLAILFVFVV
jgi:hypothetical protein